MRFLSRNCDVADSNIEVFARKEVRLRGRGRHPKHVLLVLVDAPLQSAVGDEDVGPQGLARERAEAVAALEHPLDSGALVRVAIGRDDRVRHHLRTRGGAVAP